MHFGSVIHTKKNGKLRLVIDCRSLYKFIECPSFTQEGIAAVGNIIQKDDQLVTIDLKDRFHHAPIAKQFKKYLGMYWKGQYFVWQVLPFGISCAPYYFHKCMHPVIKFLCQQNIRLSSFVNDSLVMAQQICITDHWDFVLDTLKDLGWSVNCEKCQLIPDTKAMFVGFEITTNSDKGPWLKVLPNKITKLKRVIKKCLEHEQISARSLARIISQCAAMTKAIVPAKLLLRRAYHILASRDIWESLVSISKEARRDLE